MRYKKRDRRLLAGRKRVDKLTCVLLDRVPSDALVDGRTDTPVFLGLWTSHDLSLRRRLPL